MRARVISELYYNTLLSEAANFSFRINTICNLDFITSGESQHTLVVQT